MSFIGEGVATGLFKFLFKDEFAGVYFSAFEGLLDVSA
jgi:hypothetical protein